MDIQKAIRKAIEHHQMGNLQEAEGSYKKILKKQPDNPDVLHLLGVLFSQRGDYESAVRYITKALQFNPSNVNVYYNLGNAFQRKGDVDSAINSFQKALQLNPNLPDVHYNLGTAFQEKGQLDKAIVSFRKALRFNPKLFDAHYNIGNVYRDKGQLEEAISSYQNAILINPGFGGAYCNLGNVLKQKGLIEEAIAVYQRAIKHNPEYADAYYNLGNVYRDRGQPDEAIMSYQKALQINPGYADAYYNLGNVYRDRGQPDEAILSYQKALQIDPEYADAYINLGILLNDKGQPDEAILSYQKALLINPENEKAYFNLGVAVEDKGQPDEALSYYRKAIELNPGFVDAYNNIGVALSTEGKLEEAIESYRSALILKTDFVEAYSNLGNAYKNQGNLDKAEECYREALRIKPDCAFCYNNLLLSMNYNSRYDAQTLSSEHLQFNKHIIEPLSLGTIAHANDRSPERRLRIGYVSCDFRRHSVNYFFEPALASHNHDQFEIFCYSDVQIADDVTNRLQHYADQWRNIAEMSDEQVAEMIRKDGIDIFIDLAGHTAYNRMLLFARKPVPVQVSWLGYPNTTGLSTIDYRLIDAYTDPPGLTDPYYTEDLMRMPQCFLCYLPDKNSPEVGNLPATTSGHITFGSFNFFAKVSPEVIGYWSEVLKAVQNSKLIMKAKSLSDRSTREYAMKMFIQNGIAPERIDLLSYMPTYTAHLDVYNRIDICLDTFPYNGTTTTCEALWMGVPVVTLAGNIHASRVGVSILSNIGLPELIAKTPDEYIQIAVALAADTNRLQSLRKRLRKIMEGSPLMNAQQFSLNLENCYRTMWKTWCGSI